MKRIVRKIIRAICTCTVFFLTFWPSVGFLLIADLINNTHWYRTFKFIAFLIAAAIATCLQIWWLNRFDSKRTNLLNNLLERIDRKWQILD
ncbi:MAG: hypothetical protein JJE30_16280 [Desulfuromonadales bacterium]|nr:hypothetical protein [Desulfuromonadales bacterium]